MTADIFASLQAYTEPQALGQVITGTSPENADSQSGIFAALMDEYASLSDSGEILGQALLPVMQDTEEQMITFASSNSFVRPVIELLTEETSEPDIVPESEDTPEIASDDAVIWPEDEELPNTDMPELGRTVKKLVSKVKDAVSEELQDTDLQAVAEQVIAEEGLDDIPDTLRQEIAYTVNEIAAALRHDDGKDTQPVVKLLGAVAERIAPKVQAVQPKTESDEDSDTMPDALYDIADFTGYTVITNFTPQNQDMPEEDTHLNPTLNSDGLPASSSLRKGGREGRLQGMPSEVVMKQDTTDDMPEPQEHTQTFREVFEDRNIQQEDSGQDQTGSQPQSENQHQGQSDSGTGSTSSRSRTNARQIDSRTQTDDSGTSSGTSTRRTDSRSDFAAYFEGVLTSRRTASRTSPAPLDLRGTENFTQSSGVRDGITNVVRFIRADGVQKARVVVDPPALGRISVELTSGTSGVEASIKVSSEQIRQLVQDQLSELRMNLSQQGVQVAEFTVDVQQDNSGSQNQQGQQNNPYMNFFADDDDNETEEFRIDLEDGLLYWVA